VIDLKNLGLPEHIFRYFRVSFHDLLLKKSDRSGFSLSSYSANDECRVRHTGVELYQRSGKLDFLISG
jgi:hypothetical protein